MGPKADDRPLSKEPVPVPATLHEPPTPPPASRPDEPKTREKAPRDEVGSAETRVPATEPSGSAPQPIRDLAEAGWVRIPNRGRVSPDMRDESDAPARAVRRGPDPSFERQPEADGGLGFKAGSAASSVADTDLPATSRADAGRSRVEPSLHVVNRGENFWTISRLYYGDGRYYRALWKANSQKYPDIKKIHINDVILIPAVEDLDPAYVGPPRPRAVAGRDERSTRDGVSGPDELASAGMERPESFPTTRTARTSGTPGGTPARRGSRVDAELELPVGDADNGPARGSRGAMPDRLGREDDDSPATRLTARPRNPAAVNRPVYKVRRYDTLRSIARDILGDSRRADELYDINRDVIADPTRLVPGQLLELPEDADTRRVTIRDRRRGS